MNQTSIIVSARADIEAANNGWVPALRARDGAAIAAAYTDDGLFIARDGSVTRGRDAITAMYEARFPKMREILDGAVVQDGVTAVSDSTIYEWGHAWIEMVPANAGEPPVRSGGSYLTVWQRGSDGHWHITRNIAF
jgi:uncharacterized protein (TIGR02246 family)